MGKASTREHRKSSTETAVVLPLPRHKKILFWCILFVIQILLLYLAVIMVRTYKIYHYTKANRRTWSGHVHQSDQLLGYAAVPNSQGEHIFPIGPNIPMRYDENGFRVPMDVVQTGKKPRPVILALGCSFTYGDAVTAEETFTYRLGQHLHGTALNAGICGYGYTQMLLSAEGLIPQWQPDYVIVQYSPWLVERAQSPFAPSYYGKLPVPYFYEKNGFAIHPPVFLSRLFSVPVEDYLYTPKGLFDYFSFLGSVGFPLLIYDDYHMLLYSVQRLLGITPPPTKDRQALEKYILKYLSDLAAKHHSRMIVLVLDQGPNMSTLSETIIPDKVTVVNAHNELLARLQVCDAETYRKQYALWRGDPPCIVDTHPNARAHDIIAREIFTAIKSEPGFINRLDVDRNNRSEINSK
ncbi:MAG: hypothetical protein JXD22_08870 [Sedimentisphaerales bacterium]|nr:hypothetical protein [Sedimentisphaerales bacterium]